MFLCRRLIVIVVAATSDANAADNDVLDSNNSGLAVIYCIDCHRLIRPDRVPPSSSSYTMHSMTPFPVPAIRVIFVGVGFAATTADDDDVVDYNIMIMNK